MSPNNPSDGRAERHLRVEAGAAQWQECDEAQQQAYLRIAEMIAEAIRDMPPLDAPPGEKDAVRRSRSAFVIGGRGTGKTTVLDTLRRDSQPRTLRDEKLTPIRPGMDDRGRRRQQEWATQRQDLLQQIRGRVVWLETLDMEPLPPETNLLASILVRLEAAAKGLGGEGAAATRKPRLTRGLIEPSSDYHSALLDLQRLQNDVALAWEGNLRERRGSLDPDAYAVEVMRVETSRLSLNSKFDNTLRKLAQNVFRGRDVDDVLFILPVDDFDLNPPICLDLLRLLRLISIPRLFTIALGDLNVASTVLSLKLSNDLGSIVRRLQFPMLAVVPATVASLAGDVSANAIRKLLPPAQRVQLWPMRLPEAMNFRPLGSTDLGASLSRDGLLAIGSLLQLSCEHRQPSRLVHSRSRGVDSIVGANAPGVPVLHRPRDAGNGISSRVPGFERLAVAAFQLHTGRHDVQQIGHDSSSRSRWMRQSRRTAD